MGFRLKMTPSVLFPLSLKLKSHVPAEYFFKKKKSLEDYVLYLTFAEESYTDLFNMALLKKPSAVLFIWRSCEHLADFEGHFLSVIISSHYTVTRNLCFSFLCVITVEWPFEEHLLHLKLWGMKPFCVN